MASGRDEALRSAMVAFLRSLAARNGDVATWHELQQFEFDGKRIPLIGQTGIRKIRGYEAAITILTTYRLRPEDRPYEDTVGDDKYPRYKWRGTDGMHADNAALRKALELGLPVAWFEGIDQGVYYVHVPVWIVGEESSRQQFVLALDEVMRDQWQPEALLTAPDLALRREYAEVVVRQRLHQPMFKRRVLTAYRTQCAMCRLRVRELLEAAHIKDDSEGGEPIVPNGISLCAIHHRAFDRYVLGVRPDFRIEIRRDVLDLRDGPTLQHSLQGVHGALMVLPARRAARPDPELLEERYERFLAAG